MTADSPPPPTPDVTPELDPAVVAAIESLAVELAREAGQTARDALSRRLTVEYKPDAHGKESANDPVSEVDRAVEELVRSRVAERFPGHAVIGEEVDTVVDDPSAEVLWVIDPIDGTTNFINGFPLFAVSIGVLHQGVPVAAAIWCASTHLLGPGVYHTHAGAALHLDGLPVPARETVVKRALAAAPGGAPGGTREWEHRVTGSIAIEAAYVAAGVFTSATFWGPRIWDVAAGALLVQAAGREVWVRSAGQWQRFARFTAPERLPQTARRSATANGTTDAEPPRSPGLRDWRQPMLIGTLEATTLIRERVSAPGMLTQIMDRLRRTLRSRR